MAVTRLLFAALLTAGLVAPVGLMILEVLRSPDGSTTWADADRITKLAANTAGLAGGAVLVAVPAGIVAAILLERLPIPGRAVLRAVVVVGLFVPLPVYAVAWQVVLGSWLPPLKLDPGEVAWRPWSQGLVPAAWVHGTAGFPWVVWIVGVGLRTTDRGLEDDAVITGGPGRLFRRVLLPRATVAGLAAGGWVAVQAGTEITASDAMMVRTFAEEVYTQFVGASDGLAGAVAVTLPVWLLSIAVAGWFVRPVVRVIGEPTAEAAPPVTVRFGHRARFGVTAGLWLGAIAFAGLPLAALVWKVGGGGTRSGWDADVMIGTLTKVMRSDGAILVGSGGSAAVVGAIVAGLAWIACWLAIDCLWFAKFLLLTCVFLWVTPGPLVGLGLKDTIDVLIGAENWLLDQTGLGSAILRPLLYDEPSPVPAVWACVVRLFPVAVAVLWPAVRAIPRELRDAATIDGLGTFAEWRCVVAPFTRLATVRAGVAAAAMAAGEVSATKLVNPPGRSAYVLRLFDQMHYGAESTVAALALLQIVATAAAAGCLLLLADPSNSFDRARTG